MIAVSVFLAVVCSAVFSVKGGDVWYEPQRCSSQEECSAGYCCSKKAFQDESYCVPFRKENEICLDDSLGHTMINGLYDITCPCDGELKCIKEDYLAPNGFLYSMGMPRCRKLGYSPSRFSVNSNSYAQASGGYPFAGGASNAFAPSAYRPDPSLVQPSIPYYTTFGGPNNNPFAYSASAASSRAFGNSPSGSSKSDSASDGASSGVSSSSSSASSSSSSSATA